MPMLTFIVPFLETLCLVHRQTRTHTWARFAKRKKGKCCKRDMRVAIISINCLMGMWLCARHSHAELLSSGVMS